MFYHVVLFKLKDNSPEIMDKAKEILLSMEGKIPQLKDLTVGKDELFTERSYDLCLITTFDTKEEMDEYQIHEYHVNHVLANLKPMLSASKVCDFSV
jgi:hypothetical protein